MSFDVARLSGTTTHETLLTHFTLKSGDSGRNYKSGTGQEKGLKIGSAGRYARCEVKIFLIINKFGRCATGSTNLIQNKMCYSFFNKLTLSRFLSVLCCLK